MDIVYKPISQLIDAEYNPRKLDQEQYEAIKSSLLRFGFTVPALVNTHPDRENIIIGGHQRKKIVKAEYENHGTQFDRVRYEDKQVLIPCVERALTPAEERELNIRLNKNVATWDWDKLEEFEFEDLLDWGFKEKEIQGLFEEFETHQEWFGMPEFEAEEKPIKIIINFTSEEERKKFAEDLDVEFTTKAEKTWSAWYPKKTKAFQRNDRRYE